MDITDDLLQLEEIGSRWDETGERRLQRAGKILTSVALALAVGLDPMLEDIDEVITRYGRELARAFHMEN